MAQPGIPPQPRDPYLTILRVGAIASAVVSGTVAVLAFVFGSPLEFGVALAVCAGWWITDDFVASTLGGGRRAVLPVVLRSRHEAERSSRPESCAGSGSIAA